MKCTKTPRQFVGLLKLFLLERGKMAELVSQFLCRQWGGKKEALIIILGLFLVNVFS